MYKRQSAYLILEQTLNQKDVRVFDYVEDENGNKKAVLNKKETAIAQDLSLIHICSSLPEHCYIYLPTTREIGIVKKGESGYYRSDLTPVYGEDGKQFVEELNQKGGITKAQEAAMLAGSMFGWQTPAADPRNYDEQGQPRCV